MKERERRKVMRSCRMCSKCVKKAPLWHYNWTEGQSRNLPFTCLVILYVVSFIVLTYISLFSAMDIKIKQYIVLNAG